MRLVRGTAILRCLRPVVHAVVADHAGDPQPLIGKKSCVLLCDARCSTTLRQASTAASSRQNAAHSGAVIGGLPAKTVTYASR